MARDLGGELGVPHLSWGYSQIRNVIGWTLTKRLAMELRTFRKSMRKASDKTLFWVENRNLARRSLQMQTPAVSTKPLAPNKFT